MLVDRQKKKSLQTKHDTRTENKQTNKQTNKRHPAAAAAATTTTTQQIAAGPIIRCHNNTLRCPVWVWLIFEGVGICLQTRLNLGHYSGVSLADFWRSWHLSADTTKSGTRFRSDTNLSEKTILWTEHIMMWPVLTKGTFEILAQ